jgi:hypothetical protein
MQSTLIKKLNEQTMFASMFSIIPKYYAQQCMHVKNQHHHMYYFNLDYSISFI